MTFDAEDGRPQPRSRRGPKPPPDIDIDPMDVTPPAPPEPAATTPPESAPPRGRGRGVVPASVPVTRKQTDYSDRAEVQLGVRVSQRVDEHLNAVKEATGRTRRELVEAAILALRIPTRK
ncbi:hypothetical protein ACTD5D_41215 [Nocardia takedensis]|uniref:hypothetical protein n=1 Tax=Nocardia takedensis TaxID=259390 RepID=UPI003F75E3FF